MRATFQRLVYPHEVHEGLRMQPRGNRGELRGGREDSGGIEGDTEGDIEGDIEGYRVRYCVEYRVEYHREYRGGIV